MRWKLMKLLIFDLKTSFRPEVFHVIFLALFTRFDSQVNKMISKIDQFSKTWCCNATADAINWMSMLMLMLMILDVNWLSVNADVNARKQNVNAEYDVQKLNVIIVDELMSFIVWSNWCHLSFDELLIMSSNKLLFQFQQRHRVTLDKKLYSETKNSRFILYSCIALFFQVESYRV